MHNKAIKKYLSYYAEKEAVVLKKLRHVYDYVIVIPIYKENIGCIDAVFSRIEDNNVLIIIVVNSPTKSDPGINQLFINDLIEKSYECHVHNHHCQLMKFTDCNDILMIDRNSHDLQIDPKLGVGLARKIGADVALKYFSEGCIKCPWIFSTDADVILPADYFSFIKSVSDKYSAVVTDFKHFSEDGDLNQLQFFYDLKLRYYHAGIKYAGTRYDYIPLGSTLIINMSSYAQVRGFPKRNAGEDFYLLNKVAKVKPVKNVAEQLTVDIKSRYSDRVPFGTGPALAKINQLTSVDDYKYYHPECFILLKKWVLFMKQLWRGGELCLDEPTDERLLALFLHLNCHNVLSKCRKQITSYDKWLQFVHQWFDAFKTLKAIHFFDKKIARLNYSELINDKAFAKVVGLKLQGFIHL